MFLLSLLGCGGGTPAAVQVAPVATVRNPDVVIFTVDTTRADRLGCYGYAGAHTPTIDRLAAQGLRYTHATSTLPLTIPAHGSMFTGKWPFHLNIRDNGDNLLADSFNTLAEQFQTAGYDTAASVGAFVTTRRWGFAQGFESFYDQIPEGENKNYWHNERDGSLVVDDALRWIEGHPEGTPVFLWVHLYDAHFPYIAHDGQSEELRARPYDGELAYVDQQIERVVNAMSGRNAMFVVAGDHGEGLGEHGEATHGLFTYDATQHVPWIISGAGVAQGVVDTPVSMVGLAATVVHAAGLPEMPDVDVGPQPAADTTIYAESYQLASRFHIHPHRTIVEGNYKLIALPKPELYDLTADPGERTNVADQHPDVVERLRAKLDAIKAVPPVAGSQLDADTIAQLASLGYVSAGGGGADGDPLTFTDPKDNAEFLSLILSIDQTADSPEAAIRTLQKAAQLRPDALEPRMRQIPLLARMERVDEARALAEETAAAFPNSARVWVTLAGMSANGGEMEAALGYARKALAADPMEPAAQEQAVNLLFSLGRTEEAVAEGKVFFEKAPTNYGLAASMGRHYLGNREYQEAAKYLTVAVQAPTPTRGARTQLAWLAAAAGHKEAAYPLLEAELKDYPGYLRAHKVLSDLYRLERQWAQQLPHLEALARGRRTDAMTMLALAQCQFNLKDFTAARRSLDDALALDGQNPDILLMHANLLAKEGRVEEGKKVFQQADAANTERLKKTGLPLVDRTKKAGLASPEGLPDDLPTEGGPPSPSPSPSPTTPTAPTAPAAPAAPAAPKPAPGGTP